MFSCFKFSSEHRLRSKAIDKTLLTHHKRFQDSIKILLLGTGESGKSTILKQMKILHINGFSDLDKLKVVPDIRHNVHESIYELVKHVFEMNLNFDAYENLKKAKSILMYDKYGVPDAMTSKYVEDIVALWKDSGVQECYRRSNEFHLMDSAKYFLDKVEIVWHKCYIPTLDDVLHSRKITTGIQEINFSVKIPRSLGGGNQEFRMFDVGGQRNQRNKWFQVFEGIQAILFIISCADFDQTLREDETQNRLVESLNLFRGVWFNRFLHSSGIIVFLNKQDIMEEKIRQGKRIGNYFPKSGAPDIIESTNDIGLEIARTKNFIQHRILNITKEQGTHTSASASNPPRTCYYHFTIATDTSNIRKVFNDVHNMILTENLEAIGLL